MSVSEQASDEEATLLDHSTAVETFDGEVRTTRLGRYVLLHKLGAGGMGVVYAAYDEQLDRKVAIKLLRNHEAQQRLLREARAMARLSHPNVAQVYEICEDQQQTFIVVEFVDGITLRRWLVESQPTHAEILRVFGAAGQGLVAAHAEGIVHRDFKPENVMIKKDGRVLVLDFGLAHANAAEQVEGEQPRPAGNDYTLDASEQFLHARGAKLKLTATGAMMGTPAYMPPEQFAGRETDGQTDQFSFCVALWEALYGRRPFAGASLIELAEAVSSGQIIVGEGNVPTWIRAVLERGLASDPRDRWPSMAALLLELQQDPAHHRRRIGRWATIAILVCSALGGTVWLLGRTRAELDARESELESSRAQLTIKDSDLEAQRRLARDTANGEKARQASLRVEQQRGLDALLLAVEAAQDYGAELSDAPPPVIQALFDTQALDIIGELNRLERDGCSLILDMDVSANGAHIGLACVSAGQRAEHGVDIWSPAGELQMSLGSTATPLAVALSFDGSRIVSAERDGSKGASLWRSSGELIGTLNDHPDHVHTALFSPDGSHIVTAGGRRLRVWSGDGEPIFHWDGITDKEKGNGGRPLAFSPDGQRLVGAGEDGKARIWNLSGRPSAVLDGHTGPVLAVDYSLDGQRIITASADRSARLWTADGQPIATLAGHAGPVTNVALAPDGALAVTSSHNQVWLWNERGEQLAALDRQIRSLDQGGKTITDIMFSPAGDRIIAANNDLHTWLWDSNGNLAAKIESGRQTRLVEFLPDGGVVTAGFDSTPRTWRRSPRIMTVLGSDARMQRLAFSSDDARVLLTPGPGKFRSAEWWDSAGNRLSLERGVLSELAADDSIVNGVDGIVRLLSPSGAALATFDPGVKVVDAVALSRDGTHVAAGGAGVIHVWHRLGRRVATLEYESEVPVALRFTPDGSHLFVAGSRDPNKSGHVSIWTLTGSLVAAIDVTAMGHQNHFVALSPDGSSFAAIRGRELYFWDTKTGAPIDRTIDMISNVQAFEFSRDGESILAGYFDGSVRSWRLADGTPTSFEGHTLAVTTVRQSPDGAYLATGSQDKTARLWDAKSGALLAILGHNAAVMDVGFSHDGTRVATKGFNDVVRIWYMPTAMLGIACRRLAEFPEYQRVAATCDSITRK